MKCAVQMFFLHRAAGDTFLLNFYVSCGNLKFQVATLLEGCLAENKAAWLIFMRALHCLLIRQGFFPCRHIIKLGSVFIHFSV